MIDKHNNAKVQVWQRGFKYTLTNGYTLSVAFGQGNYCENQYDAEQSINPHRDCYAVKSGDFEVAVYEPNGDMVDLIVTEPDDEGFSFKDQVLGWVPASALPMLISALKFWPDRPNFTGEEPGLPGDVAASRREAVESFEKRLRARCRMFCRIAKDYQDKAEKEMQEEN